MKAITCKKQILIALSATIISAGLSMQPACAGDAAFWGDVAPTIEQLAPPGWSSTMDERFSAWAIPEIQAGMADKLSKLSQSERREVIMDTCETPAVQKALVILADKKVADEKANQHYRYVRHMDHLTYGEPSHKKWSKEYLNLSITGISQPFTSLANVLHFRDIVDDYSHKYIAEIEDGETPAVNPATVSGQRPEHTVLVGGYRLPVVYVPWDQPGLNDRSPKMTQLRNVSFDFPMVQPDAKKLEVISTAGIVTLAPLGFVPTKGSSVESLGADGNGTITLTSKSGEGRIRIDSIPSCASCIYWEEREWMPWLPNPAREQKDWCSPGMRECSPIRKPDLADVHLSPQTAAISYKSKSGYTVNGVTSIKNGWKSEWISDPDISQSMQTVILDFFLRNY